MNVLKMLFIEIFGLWCFLSCNTDNPTPIQSPIIKSEVLQQLIDNAGVEGIILLYDEKDKKYYTNDSSKMDIGTLPASTFKIPNSIIGLEMGILTDSNSLFKWQGDDRAFDIWEQDLNLRNAFQTSCVPCYQELAQKVGVDSMNHYLKRLEYDKMDVNPQTLTNFWLIGESKITPREQIDFLRRLRNKQLKINENTYKTIDEILLISQDQIMEDESLNIYRLYGKTGRAIGEGIDFAWFVGYLTKNDKVFYFATRIKPKNKASRNKITTLRRDITKEALRRIFHVQY